jgi:hypothetical protein
MLDIDKDILKLTNKLYYINNKENINKKRKLYKRQTWKERADNKRNYDGS